MFSLLQIKNRAHSKQVAQKKPQKLNGDVWRKSGEISDLGELTLQLIVRVVRWVMLGHLFTIIKTRLLPIYEWKQIVEDKQNSLCEQQSWTKLWLTSAARPGLYDLSLSRQTSLKESQALWSEVPTECGQYYNCLNINSKCCLAQGFSRWRYCSSWQ